MNGSSPIDQRSLPPLTRRARDSRSRCLTPCAASCLCGDARQQTLTAYMRANAAGVSGMSDAWPLPLPLAACFTPLTFHDWVQSGLFLM